MTLPKHYQPQEVERHLCAYWQEAGIYRFSADLDNPVYSIDTPPPTISGNLHLGHTYSYTHPDIFARFWRMNGYAVYYPMGFDNNGLPTERLVEKTLGLPASKIGRTAFIEKCLQTSRDAEAEYTSIFTRLGLSVDWRFTYRTIDDNARRISQFSFLELYRKGLAYRQEAPSIWCPECRTALAQADLNDLERLSEFVSIAFQQEAGAAVPIATTRPELLPACVAVFIHPQDSRYQHLLGSLLTVPLFGQKVPVLADLGADPHKGTGIVMCCTFGDTADVAWWKEYHLPYIAALDRDGCLTEAAGRFAGLTASDARNQLKNALASDGLLLDRRETLQTVRVHERCDTPVEILMSPQWFINILNYKDRLLALGEEIKWYPPALLSRYQAWVSNLQSDWCISRQRYFGVPFPLWHCLECGRVNLADLSQLPVDPSEQQPLTPCACGSLRFQPEEDVLDTWATSSMSPQIAGGWRPDFNNTPTVNHQVPLLYDRVFPFTLRPQAHDIIRTWAFYTILKSEYHFSALPWKDVLISGWGVAGEGMGKISKSRGGGPMPPQEMFTRYSADAVRYWASSTGAGKDAVISEEKIQLGARLATKLWNVSRFSEPFLPDTLSMRADTEITFSAADRWILSQAQALIRRVTKMLQEYEYAAAKSEIESFFWRDLADNYLEMCKQRLYAQESTLRRGACFTLHRILLTTLKLFAPFLPFITEQVYLSLFASSEPEETARKSIHLSSWPQPDPAFENPELQRFGEALISIVTSVRRFKSEHSLPLSSDIKSMQLMVVQPGLKSFIIQAVPDLASACRALQVQIVDQIDPGLVVIEYQDEITIGIQP
jgi:valyl-tRNA synthetase